MRLYVLADISLEVKATSDMSTPLGIIELQPDRKAPHQRYEELLRSLAEIRRQRAVAVAELVARPLMKKDVIAEQPNRAAPITEVELAVLDDEPADEPDLSDIFVANDAIVEKIMEQRK